MEIPTAPSNNCRKQLQFSPRLLNIASTSVSFWSRAATSPGQSLHLKKPLKSAKARTGDASLNWPRCTTKPAIPAMQFGQHNGPSNSPPGKTTRSEEHTSELQSLRHLVCR